jgi:hypothetical protein
VAGAIVTVPVPDGLIVTVALAGLNPTVELASSVVKLPAALVVAPMLMLLIVPAVLGLTVNAPAGLIVTVPVPVGLSVTAALAGLNVVVLDVVSVVKAPEFAVTDPIGVL